MKIVEIKEAAFLKLKKNQYELKVEDLETSSKSYIPGEWILLFHKKTQSYFLAYINLFSESFFKIKVLSDILATEKNKTETVYLREAIEKSCKKRTQNKLLKDGCRAVYGGSDALTGLIVDVFVDNVFIQINTAGMDRFRDEIKKICQDIFPNKEILFLDNDSYRKNEQLPMFENDQIPDVVNVKENGLVYQVTKESFQKIGFYYDHRINRQKLESHLKNYELNFQNGLDLFSYVGSWGLHMLRAGVSYVTFVDQGAMESAISNNLERNQFSGRGTFVRSDVFKFLDQQIIENKKYDVIVSDPPAFTKSEKNKANALVGYDKLHAKCLRILKEDGFFVAASCTHYVTLEELDKSVQAAARKESKELFLLDLGIQSPDHPIRSLNDKSNYIKFLLYKVS